MQAFKVQNTLNPVPGPLNLNFCKDTAFLDVLQTAYNKASGPSTIGDGRMPRKTN